MNRYTFVLPSKNQNACSAAVTQGPIFFCKDIHETLKYVDAFSELKKNDEIHKEHTHLCFQSLQIVWIQKVSDNQRQTGIPRIYHVSERPTLHPMPRNNKIEP